MMAMVRVENGHERKLASDFGIRQRHGARCARATGGNAAANCVALAL
jgi:hypothetical protein